MILKILNRLDLTKSNMVSNTATACYLSNTYMGEEKHQPWRVIYRTPAMA
jgi:hypothetical protein